ncbi:MAG: hypothetical protein E4H36_08530, partial [Spirochaetales bacterium]
MKGHKKTGGKGRHYKRSKKTGLPPGSPVPIGDLNGGGFICRQIMYSANDVREHDFSGGDEKLSALAAGTEPGTNVWLQIAGVHYAEAVEKMGNAVGLHPLMIEDIVNMEQRVKLEDYPDTLFLVMKLLQWDTIQKQVVLRQAAIVIKNGVLITFLDWSNRDYLKPIVDRIRNQQGNIRDKNLGYLLYVILDYIVDNYFFTVESLEGEIDTIEEVAAEAPDRDTIGSINSLRRELLVVKKLVWAVREVLLRLERGNYPFINREDYIFYRDIQDHILYIIDTMDTFREIITGLVDVYLS